MERWDRGAPFFDKTWKEVGITWADEIRVGVMVMQDDILVGKHWPKNEKTPEQWVGYNVWGDHSFFYTSDAMKHLGSMKVLPNGKKALEKRLMQLQDDRERTPFIEIEWYDLGDVQEAIEKKKANTFKTCNIKAAQEQLREHNVTFYSQYMDPPEVVKALNIHVSKKRQGKNSKEMTAIIRIVSVPNALRLLLPQGTEVECGPTCISA